MKPEDLKAYRRQALDRLEQLLISLPEVPHEADFFVDTAIRQLSQLPGRPEGAEPYRGLYGEKATLDDYRDVATDRLEDLVMPLGDIADVDRNIDKYLRLLSELPERPADRNPYEGLFVLRTDTTPDPVTVDPSAAEGGGKTYLTTDQLVQVAGTGDLQERLKLFTPGVNACFDKYQINTPLRMAHFLAQVMHESGGFRWLREIWGPTATQARYEGRRDLGNTQGGDGKRFMGRGLIQLTGRSNYAQFSKDYGVDFVAKPELVEQAPYAVMVAGWYWNSRNINKLADSDDLRAVTRAINGGYNGIKDREKYLKRAKLIIK